MKPAPSPEHHEQDEELTKLLKELGALRAKYPAELWSARRAAFLAQLEELSTVDPIEELPAAEQEIVKRLAPLKSVSLEYPAELLTARREAFLRQVERAGEPSVWDKLHASFQRIFLSRFALPTLSPAGLRQISLVIGSLLMAVLVGSLFRTRMEGSFPPAAMGRHPFRASTAEAAIAICSPEEQLVSCSPRQLHARQDLADPGNGPAQPAVSKDARAGAGGVHRAAYVNDGDSGGSWISASTDSWIKIDLGQVTTINTVSLRKGSPDPSQGNAPGRFAIAVALSDVYADGDSNNDDREYAQVFDSAQTSLSDTVSPTETIQTRFPPIRARFVKITFEKADTAIEEVGVFMAPPPVLAERPTSRPADSQPASTLTPMPTSTLLAANPVTSVATGLGLPTDTAIPIATDTDPPLVANTPIPLPTDILPPADTSTPVPLELLPSDTPIPLPTSVPPTGIPPTVQLLPPSTDTIVVTGNDQTLTFICNDNDAVIRGHANTVTLLGSCSSITVTGNGNRVFWESGSPAITNKGKDNVISQQ